MEQRDKKKEQPQSYSWSKFFIQIFNILLFLALIAKIIAINIEYT